MVHDGLEPLRAPAIPGQDAVIKPLAKDATAAKNTITPETTREDRKLNPSSTERQICWPAPIAALHTPATAPAARTDSPRSARSQQDLHPVRHHLHRIYCKTTRREARALKTMLHLLILLRTSTNLGRNSSKCESEPLLGGNQQRRNRTPPSETVNNASAPATTNIVSTFAEPPSCHWRRFAQRESLRDVGSLLSRA